MTNAEDLFHQQIDQLEICMSIDIEAARKQLRVLLFEEGKSGETGTIGDALSILAQRNTEYRHLAPVILRCLPVSGLIPENNPTNQIARSIVRLAMGSLPRLCEFLRVSSTLQTFESYTILRGAHDRICSLLSPLQNGPTSLDQFLAARHSVVECLHHSAIVEYCTPFGLAAVTTCIEQVFALMRKISTTDQSALQHQIRLFMNFMDASKTRLGGGSNFFIQSYFNRFLDAAGKSVDGYLAQTRGRFAAPRPLMIEVPASAAQSTSDSRSSDMASI